MVLIVLDLKGTERLLCPGKSIVQVALVGRFSSTIDAATNLNNSSWFCPVDI